MSSGYLEQMLRDRSRAIDVARLVMRLMNPVHPGATP
jgi:hypothetical protein